MIILPNQKFLLKNSNSNIIFIDNSEKVSSEFKEKLIGVIIRILEAEEVVLHLRDIQIFFDDSYLRPQVLEKIYKKSNLPPEAAFDLNREGIVLNIDEYFTFYNFNGIGPLYKYIKTVITHELVHYLHHSINKNLEKLWAAHLRLREKYKKKYKVFKETLGLTAHETALDYLNLFIFHCVAEGFAMFFDKLKNKNLKFTKEQFNLLYNEAIEATRILNEEFKKFSGMDKNSLEKIKKFSVSKLIFGLDKLYYIIGFHIIYSIMYLHKDIIEKDIDFLLGSFKTFFGKLSPRKVIDIYEDLIAENNF